MFTLLRGSYPSLQSEEEKQFQRLKRREDKKIARKGEKGGQEEQEYIQSLNFDPKLLRAQRLVDCVRRRNSHNNPTLPINAMRLNKSFLNLNLVQSSLQF